MRRKGSYIVPLFLLVLLAGPVSLGITMLVPAMASSTLQTKAYDLRNAPQAKSTATFLRQHYFPESMNWSIYQTTYELAQNGGGASWSPDSIPSEDTLTKTLEQRVAGDYQDAYRGGSFPEQVSRCKIAFPAFTFTVAEKQVVRSGEDGARFQATTDGDVAVTCATQTARTVVFVNPDTDVFSGGNRYFLLYREMVETVERLQTEWGNVQGPFQASGRACGSASTAESNAKDNAEAKAVDAVTSAFNDALQLPSGLSYAESTTDVQAASTIPDGGAASEAGDCNCECVERAEDGSCTTEECDTAYTAEAEARPESASATIGIQDDRYTIPTAAGDTPLEFRVDGFSYSFQ